MPSSETPHIAIIGAGFIGRAWSIVFARAGIQVRLWDPDQAAAAASKDFIAARLPELHAATLITENPDAILARITIAPTLESATEAAITCGHHDGSTSGWFDTVLFLHVFRQFD